MSNAHDIDRRESKSQAFSSGAGVGENRRNIGMGRGKVIRFTPQSHMIAGNLVKILKTNPQRKYFMLQNQSAADIYIGFGIKIDTFGNNGFLVPSGGFYELDNVVPFDAVYIIGVAAGQRVLVIEGALGER